MLPLAFSQRSRTVAVEFTRRVLCALALGWGSAASIAAGPSRGILIESIPKRSSLAAADLQPADVVLQAGSRKLRTPLDLSTVETEEAPLGPVRLKVRRGTATRWAVAPPGEWLVEARPVLPAAVEALYTEGLRAMESGDYPAGRTAWTAAAEQVRTRGD